MNSNEKLTFPKNLKKLRKEMNLTQEELSKKLNISRQTLSYYETGNREPEINTLVKISRVFNCSLDFLLLGDNTQTVKNDKLNKILNFTDFSNIELLYSLVEKRNNIYDSLSELNNIINFLNSSLEDSEKVCDDLYVLEENTINLNLHKNENYSHYENSDVKELQFYPFSSTYDLLENYIIGTKPNSESKDLKLAILKFNGNSMNKCFNNNDLIFVQSTEKLENGEIGIFVVNNKNLYVKRYSQKNNSILLEPMSYDPIHKTQQYDIRKDNIKIVGKVIGSIKPTLTLINNSEE